MYAVIQDSYIENLKLKYFFIIEVIILYVIIHIFKEILFQALKKNPTTF